MSCLGTRLMPTPAPANQAAVSPQQYTWVADSAPQVSPDPARKEANGIVTTKGALMTSARPGDIARSRYDRPGRLIRTSSNVAVPATVVALVVPPAVPGPDPFSTATAIDFGEVATT